LIFTGALLQKTLNNKTCIFIIKRAFVSLLKNVVIRLALCFGCAQLTAQVVSSRCTAADSIVQLYRNDADRLAIRHANQTRSSYKDSVVIHKQYRANYLSALLAVHNATGLPAQDTITRLLNIHTYNPGLNSLILYADSNLVWMSHLRKNILPTGDYELDKIIKRYGLRKIYYSGLLQPSMVVFRADSNSNLDPLARRMRSFVGVKAAESDYLYGDGNDIKDVIHENYTELVYSYGWQACPTGCEQRRYWKFKVYYNCSVEYAGSYGSPLEPSLVLSVHENEELFKDIKIYPNPSKNKFYIEDENAHKRKVKLTVTNKKEEIVYSLDTLQPKQEVDLILLSRGVYYLTLQNNSERKVYKIRKQ
jgi:hypothetical protein